MHEQIVIIDYGMGNIRSIEKALSHLNKKALVSNKPEDLIDATKIILPGVGHFQKAMINLEKSGLIDALNDAVLNKKIPVLGICLGMQLMTNHSEEGNVNGLGWIDAEVVRFKVSDPIKFKIPHIGWNSIRQLKESKISNQIPDNSLFYFVHSYHVTMNASEDALHETIYDKEFISAFEKDTIFGVQYHPEKSHDVGLQLIKNFIEL